MDCAVLSQPYNHISFKRRKTTWYSVKDGNWTDPTVWQSNATKRWSYPGQNIPSPVFPQVGDDVYVGHSVTINVAGLVVNNAVISGSLIFGSTARTITVSGDMQAVGAVDMSSAAHNLILNGVNNYIVNFTSGTTSTVTYARLGDQNIMNLSYRNLTITGSATKYLISSLTLAGNLSLLNAGASNTFELGGYDLTVNGTSTTFAGTVLSKTATGNLLFVGQLNNAQNQCIVNFSGNPAIELRGGYNNGGSSGNSYNFGSGTISVTTNSQTFSSTGTTIPLNTVVISSGITLTTSGTGVLQINNSINGLSSGSTLLNKGLIYLNTTTSPMSTGVFDYQNFVNTVGYIFNGDFALPSSTYRSLYISGTGTKSPPASLTLQENLSIAGGVLELSTLDLTVNGATNMVGGSLSKTGSGAVLLVGQLVLTTNGSALNLVGNPSLELRGGISWANAVITMNGSPTMTFTTNNQSIATTGTNSSIPYNVLISGAITVTESGTGSLAFTGVLNGNNAASTYDNRGTTQYQATQRPMLTGILQTNAAANTFLYNRAGDQDITGGTYRTLTLGGSGVKTLQGNVVVTTAYTLTPPATLNTNGFTRT